MAVALLLHPLRRQLEVVVVATLAGVVVAVALLLRRLLLLLEEVVVVAGVLDGVVATILVAGVAIMVAGVAILGKSSMNESMNHFISL